MAVDEFQFHIFIAFKYCDVGVWLRDQVSRVGYHFDCVDVHTLRISECKLEGLFLDFDPTSVVFGKRVSSDSGHRTPHSIYKPLQPKFLIQK